MKNRFGAALKNARNRTGLSIREAASRLGISPTTVCDIETGNRKGGNPTAKTIILFCNFYGLDMGPILGLLAGTRHDAFHCRKCGNDVNEFGQCAKCGASAGGTGELKL